jgi:hypothetical protein
MILLSELVAICASHNVDSEATLSQFARELRDAGRVSKAGRGRGAARMTFLDAARFLIACAATDHPKRVVEAEAFFSAYVLKGAHAPENAFTLPDGISMDEAFASVLEVLASGKLDADALAEATARAEADGHKHVFALRPSPELNVDRSGGAAEVAVFGASHRFTFWHSSMIALIESVDALEGVDRANDLTSQVEQQALRFRTGKNLSARLDSPLLRAVASAVGGKIA